jgi:osmotically-inducible protein OsmY
MNSRAAFAIAMVCLASRVDGETPQSYLLDPFAQATSGYHGCTAVAPPILDEQQMRSQAHSRAERGTSCCLAGTCECGGPYKHDAEINDRVVEAIRADKRFRDTAVWVTTTRGFVSLQGCVRGPAQKNALGRTVKRLPGVVLVWNGVTTKRPGK